MTLEAVHFFKQLSILCDVYAGVAFCALEHSLCCCFFALIFMPKAVARESSLLVRSCSLLFVSPIKSMSSVKQRLQTGLPLMVTYHIVCSQDMRQEGRTSGHISPAMFVEAKKSHLSVIPGTCRSVNMACNSFKALDQAKLFHIDQFAGSRSFFKLLEAINSFVTVWKP